MTTNLQYVIKIGRLNVWPWGLPGTIKMKPIWLSYVNIGCQCAKIGFGLFKDLVHKID